MDWNGLVPDVIGQEFVPDGLNPLRAVRVTALANGAAITLASTVTESVTDAAVVVAGDTPKSQVLVETFLAGDELIDPTDIQVEIIPVIDCGNPTQVLNWQDQGGAISAAAFVTALSSSNPATYISPLFPGADRLLGLSFDTVWSIAHSLAGRRILDVTIKIMGGLQPVQVDPLGTFQIPPNPSIGGGSPVADAHDLFVSFPYAGGIGLYKWNNYRVPFETTAALDSERSFSTAETMPGGDLSIVGFLQPWRLDDLAAMGTNLLYIDVSLPNVKPGDVINSAYFNFISMEVTHCRENRLTRDAFVANSVAPHWEPVNLYQPNGSSRGIAKVAGTDLTALIRQPRFGDARPSPLAADYRFSAPYPTGINVPAAVNTHLRPGIDADGTVSILDPPSATAILPFHLKAGGVQSVDSQPYASVTVGQTDGAITYQQEIVTTSALTYDGVLLPLAVSGPGSVPLVVQLRRRSDSALLATATIQVSDLAGVPPVGAWRRVQAPFAAPVALAAATLYYFQIAPVNPTTVWSFPVMDNALPAGSVGGQATYGGQTEAFTDTARQVTADQPAVLYIQPATPGGFTATGVDVPFDLASPCGPQTVPAVDLAWTHPVVSLFAFYEIQRLDPGATTWETIAQITDDLVLSMRDVEPDRGKTSAYRIRQVDATGIGSTWATTTTAVPVGGCGLTITSNALPAAGVAYVDTFDPSTMGERTSTEPGATETVFLPIYGRDDVVAFRPLTTRGPLFSRRLEIPSFGQTGAAVFQPILDLTAQPVPYFCVRDENGDRWFADVTVKTTSAIKIADIYRVDVDIRQTARIPYPVDVAP